LNADFFFRNIFNFFNFIKVFNFKQYGNWSTIQHSWNENHAFDKKIIFISNDNHVFVIFEATDILYKIVSSPMI